MTKIFDVSERTTLVDVIFQKSTRLKRERNLGKYLSALFPSFIPPLYFPIILHVQQNQTVLSNITKTNMSAASTSLEDDGGGESTTSSDGGVYLGAVGGQKQFPNHPQTHLGGKTFVGGKSAKSMGEDTTDNDSDTDDNENGAIGGQKQFPNHPPPHLGGKTLVGGKNIKSIGEDTTDNEVEEELSLENDDDDTVDEEGTFQKQPPTVEMTPKSQDKLSQPPNPPKCSTSQPIKEESQSQLEAWRQVHAALVHAVLVAKEAIASKKLQRRFWLETICGNLAHPNDVNSTAPSASKSVLPSQMPLLMSHSVWIKPDQRKKKRGSKKHPHGIIPEEPKPKKPRKKKSDTPVTKAAPSGDPTLSGAKKTKKKVAKGASLLKKRKVATLPLKVKTKLAAKGSLVKGKPDEDLVSKKGRVTAILPTNINDTEIVKKSKISLSVNTSKIIPAKSKVQAPVLSVFQDEDESDDEMESNKGNENPTAQVGSDSSDSSMHEKDGGFILPKADLDNDNDTTTKKASFYAFASNEDDVTSSDDLSVGNGNDDVDDKEVEATNGDANDNEINGEGITANVQEDDGVRNGDNSSDNEGPDWNASQQSHPFLKKRRTSINHVSTQGTLDSSEIYSTFRPDASKDSEVTGNEASAQNDRATAVYDPFGGSDSSEDEIPF